MKRKGQVNWADGSSLMMIFLATVFGAVFAAMDLKSAAATAIGAVCGGLIGFVVGFAGAQVSGRLAYSVLNSKTLGDAIQVVLYLVLPMPFISGTPFLAIWLVSLVKHLF